MKTLQQIRDEVAKEFGYDKWSEFAKEAPLSFSENVSKRYAHEVAKEALRNASENALMKYHCGHFKTDTPTQYHQHGADNIQIDKQSILSEINIPQEVKS